MDDESREEAGDRQPREKAPHQTGNAFARQPERSGEENPERHLGEKTRPGEDGADDGRREVAGRQHAEEGGGDDRPEEDGGTDREGESGEMEEEDGGIDPATRAHTRRASEESGPPPRRDRAGSARPGVPPVRTPASNR